MWGTRYGAYLIAVHEGSRMNLRRDTIRSMAKDKKHEGKKGRKKHDVPVTSPAPTVPGEAEYTLDALLARLGPATEEEVLAYIEGATDEELIAEGRQVDTARIDTDTARIYGRALDFIERAQNKEQEKAEKEKDKKKVRRPAGPVRGVTRALLRVGVWAAVQGHDAYVALRTGIAQQRSGRALNQDTAEETRQEGRDLHVELIDALRAVAGQKKTLLARIAQAANLSAAPEGLAGSIRALVAIGREMLADPSPAMKLRLADGESGVTTEYLDACEETAGRVAKAESVGGAVLPSPEVSQAEVDRWDGINLVLLETVIRAFEAGHRVNPTVPRVLPISLRTYFTKTKRSAKSTEPAVAVAEAGGKRERDDD